MSSSNSSFLVLDPEQRRQLLVESASRFLGRMAIHERFDQINGRDRTAYRKLGPMPAQARSEMLISALSAPSQDGSSATAFMVEAVYPMSLEVRTLDAPSAPKSFSVCLPLTGEVRLNLDTGPCVARPGEALVIDPSRVELTAVATGTHFIEFNLPKATFISLGAELAPGQRGRGAAMAPLIRGELANRLLYMAVQLGGCLRDGSTAQRRLPLFNRWSELVILTLLDEHAQLEQGAGSTGGAPPLSLKRAIEFIEAHAHEEVLLADIASAACVSASSLLRLFREHLHETPGSYLRQTRLDLARRELLRGGGHSIRDMLHRWGFRNPSKFAQAYFKRFGELPSDTRALRRGIGQAR